MRVGGPARWPVGSGECRRVGGSCEHEEGDWEVAFGGRWCSEELAFGLGSCRTAPAGTAERARAAEAPGALEPAGQMPNTVKGVVDNEVSKPLML